MNKKSVLLILVCSLALNIGFAGTYAFNMISHSNKVIQTNCSFILAGTPLYANLGLRQTQIDRIEPVIRDFHEKTAVLREQIMTHRRQLVDEMAKDTIDHESLNVIHNEISAGQSKLQQLVMQHILDMKQAMDPDQRARFFEAMRCLF